MRAMTAMQGAMTAAARLVQSAEARSRSRMMAYRAVAGKVGMSAAWVRRLVAGGVKSINTDLKQRLDELLVRELEAELARLQHELEMARQGGDHFASEHVCEVEAHIAAARSLLSKSAEW